MYEGWEKRIDVVSNAYPISEDTLRRCFPNGAPTWIIVLFGVLGQRGVAVDVLVESVDQANEDIETIRKRIREVDEPAPPDCPDCGDKECHVITCPKWNEAMTDPEGKQF